MHVSILEDSGGQGHGSFGLPTPETTPQKGDFLAKMEERPSSSLKDLSNRLLGTERRGQDNISKEHQSFSSSYY